MLNIYTIEQSAQWDAVVRSFSEHDTYWLSGYVKAFKIHGDGEPLLFFYVGKRVRGINVVMKRDISNDPHFKGKLERGVYFDFSTPYGYGGWLIEGDDSGNLFATYEEWCSDNGIISEFVRFHPVISNQKYSENNYDVFRLGRTVTLDLYSPEIIWENITSKNRNMIRKAQKNGIVIYNGCSHEIYDIFREIYNETMNKNSADPYYYFEPAFYESVLNDLSENAKVFYALLDGKVIAASIMLVENGRMNYHLSGSVRECANLAPTNLILYEAVLWGCANGWKTLYLGGGVGSCEDGLFCFKKSFYKGELNSFFIGKKIILPDKYDELVKIVGKADNSTFFPLYRA